MKLTISISEDLVKQIDIMAKKLCLSRSAFISTTMAQKLQSDKTVDDLSKLIDIYQKEKGN